VVDYLRQKTKQNKTDESIMNTVGILISISQIYFLGHMDVQGFKVIFLKSLDFMYQEIH